MRVGCEDKKKEDPAHVPAGQLRVSREAAIDRMIAALGGLEARPAVTAAFAAAATAVLAGSGSPPVTVAEMFARAEKVERARGVLARLLADPGVAQRTPEWYAARQTMVTASDVAQALGCAKFGNQRTFFQKKCGLPEEQTAFDATLPPLRWGVIFEPVAQTLYSDLNGGVRVHEFGLLRHPTLPFVGASPDGITEQGVMLEIKCPWRRKIVEGEVPMQYYYQIQAQLAVCGLAECDYFECEFSEVQQDPLGPTGVVDCEWSDAVVLGKAGAFVEVATGGECAYPPAGIATSRLAEAVTGWAYGELGRRRSAPSAAASAAAPVAASATPRIVWWILRKAACTRVEFDSAFCADVFARLKVVWDRTIDYRGDRDRYLAEVGAAIATSASASARSNSEAARGHEEDDAEAGARFNRGSFAFVDEDEAST